MECLVAGGSCVGFEVARRDGDADDFGVCSEGLGVVGCLLCYFVGAGLESVVYAEGVDVVVFGA